MIPLNQTYRKEETLKIPSFHDIFWGLVKYAYDVKFTKFVNGEEYTKGRIYDYALIMDSGIDFNDKMICELGARDGFFGSYLTKFAKKVHVSDYFEGWGKGTESDLGDFIYWFKTWVNTAINPHRLSIETQNMLNLDYPDNYFDIVISTSVIEHLKNQTIDHDGDMVAIKEMVRICKPGGIIALSTDMGTKCEWYSGTFYYDEEQLFKRLIDYSGCKLRGKYEFSLEGTDMHHVKDDLDSTGVTFTLQKPE